MNQLSTASFIALSMDLSSQYSATAMSWRDRYMNPETTGHSLAYCLSQYELCANASAAYFRVIETYRANGAF